VWGAKLKSVGPGRGVWVEAIEQAFGEPLEWQELPGKKATRIVVYSFGVDPSDEAQHDGQHAWMLTKMDRFHAVFANRVKLLASASARDGGDCDSASVE